jgi:murein DD-endopeptidase MepM/ murein hydrolase activator NlpD
LVACLLLGGVAGFFAGRFTAFEEIPRVPAEGPAASVPANIVQEAQPADSTGGPVPAAPAPAPAPASSTAPSASPVAPPTPPEAQSAAKKIRRLDLTISGSLAATLGSKLDAREADLLTAQLGRILLWWVNMRRDMLPGDRLTVLYEPTTGPGELRVLAMRFVTSKTNQVFRTYFFKRPAGRYGRYYDEGGTEIEQRLENGPLAEYEQVTELLNLSGRARHRGVDFKTDMGTEVVNPFRAQVLRRNWQTRANGNCLEMLFVDKGIKATFLHLSQILPVVVPGSMLQPGTVIALTGNTGHSTAPHLHYQLEDSSGRLLNPFKVHKTYRQKLEGEDLKAFNVHRDTLDKQLDDTRTARGNL